MSLTLSALLNQETDSLDGPQQRFQQLWQQLQSCQQEFADFRQSIDALTEQYQQQVLPAERKLLPGLELLQKRLMVLFTRKSLAQWHREAMIEWVQELMAKAQSLDEDTGDRMLLFYQQTLADMHDMTLEELQEEWRERDEIEQEHAEAFQERVEEFKERFRNMATDEQRAQLNDMFDFFGGGPEQDELFGSLFESLEDTAAESPGSESSSSDGDVVSPQQLMRKLFKRTAQALHPDREPDEAKKVEKQQLMTTLLKARDEDDLMTVLNLHAEYVAGELPQAEHELEAMCQLLEAQLAEHDELREGWVFEHPLRTMVVDNFYDEDPKVSDERMKLALAEIQEQAEGTMELAAEMRNLNILKSVLREREDTLAAEYLYRI